MLCAVVFLAFGLALYYVYPYFLHRLLAWSYGCEYLGNQGVEMQSKENNCGPSSLAMVYGVYGIHVTERDIERSLRLTSDGTTMLALRDRAACDGLKAQGWRLSGSELRDMQFPVILYVRGDHFIVADSDQHGFVYLRDPAIGRLRISEKDLVRMWHGETLVFSRN